MKSVDFKRIINDADDLETVCRLREIEQQRKSVEKKNVMENDHTSYVLSLNKLKFYFERQFAFSQIEVYEEIFCHNGHMEHPAFIPQDGNIILDIGANHGYYSMKAKQHAPQCMIFALEPVPETYSVLSKNIELNHLQDIQIFRNALSSECGTIKLGTCPQITAISGLEVDIPERKGGMKKQFIHEVQVPALSLKTFITKNNIPHIDILKLDVEGSEVEILKSIRNLPAVVDRIVLEWHSFQLRKEILTILKDASFEMVLEKHGEGEYYGEMYFIKGEKL